MDRHRAKLLLSNVYKNLRPRSIISTTAEGKSEKPKIRCRLLFCTLLLCSGVIAQVAPGFPNFTEFDRHEVDTVDLMNNNIVLTIPGYHKAGSMPFDFELTANSYVYVNGVYWEFSLVQSYGSNPAFTPAVNGIVGNWTSANFASSSSYTCNGILNTKYTNWYVQTVDGAVHWLPSGDYTTSASGGTCHNTFTDSTSDGSGYTVVAVGGFYSALYDRAGNNYYLGTLTDPHNNTITLHGGTGNSFYDSMGLPTVNVSSWTMGLPNAPSYSWTDVNGGTPTLGQSTQSLNTKTVFNCTGLTDISSGSPYLTTGFSLPDGRSIGLAYEGTPGYGNYYTGRIGEITLPEGGTITYTYGPTTHNGIDCTYKTVPVLTRTLGNGDKTTYTLTHNLISGSNYNAVNTMVDPGGNQTKSTFTGFTSTGLSSTYGQVLTEIQRYQGTSTLLSTDIYCYNTAFSSCSTTTAPGAQVTLPISKKVVFHQLAGMSNWSATETHYDGYGNLTYSAQYDFGASSPTRATTITYYQASTSCGALSTGSVIQDRPCEVQTTQGGSVVADAKYTYSTQGNLLTTSVWNGSAWIGQTTANSYNSNGTPNKSYDLANNETDYNYAAGNYYDGCSGVTNYPFATSVTNVATGITISATYDCTGGVKLSDIDANGNGTTYGYINHATTGPDPYWRVSSAADPYSVTAYNYYPDGSSFVDLTILGQLSFNSGNSVIDPLVYTDGYGRPITQQLHQSPSTGNYDTVSTVYGWSGSNRSVATSQPCSATLAGSCTTVHTSLYDPLDRLLASSTTNNEMIAHTYTQNDDLMTVTSGPSVQTEYDGLGRVKSMCHIGTTTSTGSGTLCNQATGSSSGAVDAFTYTSGTGWTKVSVTRAGTQLRSQTFDALGRITQNVTPEGGAWNYFYDSIPSACTGLAVNHPGQLVCQEDARGVYNGFNYDALGRLTNVGTSVAPETCKRFLYDNTSGILGSLPSGVTLANQYGRLVEAETDDCSWPVTGAHQLTDEWFAYDKDGRVATMWEKTPHSTQYYKSTATFYDNGAVNTVTLASPANYTLTYGIDGEGRPSTLTDTTSSNTLVYSSTFFPAANPAVVTLKASGGDNDAYTFDTNTGRVSQYEFTVGSANLTGALSWTAQGHTALASLTTTDGFNAGGTLTSSDAYDSWNRLTQFDNGSGNWGQNYTYDIYDNLSKSVISGRTGTTWNPGYSASTNHCTGCTYDAGGNQASDGSGVNFWGWNEYSKMAWYNTSSGAPTCGTNGRCMTYDAFGREVEYSNGGAWTELWLNQAGGSANMSGTTLNYAYWPAPEGGEVIVLGNSTGFQYLHKDWLGNARVASDIVAKTVTADQAYTPYGEVFGNFGSANSYYDEFAGMKANFNTGIQYETPNREFAIFGRWLSPDPANQGWNQYAYPTNPNSFIDPSGLYLAGPGQCEGASGDPCGGADGGVGGPGDSINQGFLIEVLNGYWPRDGGAWVTTSSSFIYFPGNNNIGSSGCYSLTVPCGGIGAANNGTKNSILTPQQQKALHCLGQAASAKGFSIFLDVAGSIPAFGNLFSGTVEGVQALNAGYYGLVSLSNAGNTLLNPSASGAANTAATAGFAFASLALKGSKAIPVVGSLVSLGFLAYDVAGAVSTYQQCMAGPG